MSIGDALETATSVVLRQKAEANRLEALREQATALRVQAVRASPLIAYGRDLANVLKEMTESPRMSAFFGAHQPQVRCMSAEHFYLDSADSRLISPGLADRQSVVCHHVHLDIKLKTGVNTEQVSLWVEIYRVGGTNTRVMRRRKMVSSPEDAVGFVEPIVADFVVQLEQAAEVDVDASMARKL